MSASSSRKLLNEPLLELSEDSKARASLKIVAKSGSCIFLTMSSSPGVFWEGRQLPFCTEFARQSKRESDTRGANKHDCVLGPGLHFNPNHLHEDWIDSPQQHSGTRISLCLLIATQGTYTTHSTPEAIVQVPERLTSKRAPHTKPNRVGGQAVGLWMWDDLGWSSFFFGLGLEENHVPAFWLLLYLWLFDSAWRLSGPKNSAGKVLVGAPFTKLLSTSRPPNRPK